MHRFLHVTGLVLLLSGCGGAARRADLEPTPDWMKSDRGKLEARLDIAESLLENGSYGQAMTLVAMLRSEGEDDPRIDYLQGWGLQEQGVASEAERLLTAAADKMRGDARPWRRLGVLYADNKNLDQAIASLEKATELDENDAATWNNLGFLLMSQGRHEDAAQALQRAVALDATVPRYRNNLGFALAGQGEFDDALNAFRSTGSNADAYANMGVAYEKAGDADQALVNYEKALELSPAHKKASEAVKRLTEPEIENEEAEEPALTPLHRVDSDQPSTQNPKEETP